MKLSIWAALPVYALTSSALVIRSGVPANDAIAGSLALPNVTISSNQTQSALESKYEKLEFLKHQIFELHHRITQQEHEILALINRDFQSCSGVKCYFQTAVRKTPDFYELLKTHFRHHPKDAKGKPWNCSWSSKSREGPTYIDIETTSSLPAPPENGPHNHGDATLPPPPPSSLPDDIPFHPDDHDMHGPPQHDSGPFRFGDGPPPPPPPHPNGEPFRFSHGPPPPPPPPHGGPFGFGDGPQPPPTHHPEHHPGDRPPHRGPGRHPFHMPHPAPRHRHFRLILATAGGLVSILILATLFKAARVYLSNPRVRADRAARSEECRTRREYRRAACQHRLRQCLSRFGRRRRSSQSGDDEEKRAMLQRSDSEGQMGQHIVGTDIEALRRAHAIVGQLMRAEEGRMNTHNGPASQQHESTQQAQLPDTVIDESAHSTHSLQTMTTLPPYAPPPPRYSQELSRDMEVVDGFRYTPSQSEATITSSASSFVLDDADLCTESSVVDCRSRMSIDTESVAPSQTRARNRKSLELASDQYRGRFD